MASKNSKFENVINKNLWNQYNGIQTSERRLEGGRKKSASDLRGRERRVVSAGQSEGFTRPGDQSESRVLTTPLTQEISPPEQI